MARPPWLVTLREAVDLIDGFQAPSLSDWRGPEDWQRAARERIDREGTYAGMPERIIARAARRRAEVESAAIREYEAWATKCREMRAWRGRSNTFNALEACLVDSYQKGVSAGLLPDEDGQRCKRTQRRAWRSTAIVLDLKPISEIESWWRERRRQAAIRSAAWRVRRAGEQVEKMRVAVARAPGLSARQEFTIYQLMAGEAAVFWFLAQTWKAGRLRNLEYLTRLVTAGSKIQLHARFLDDTATLKRVVGRRYETGSLSPVPAA